jgi:23S rRNA pseudouridine1911/1915/1917 synthase
MTKIINERKLNIKITEGKKKERLDLYLANNVERATRSKIQKLIKADLVKVNGKFEKANYLICPGDEIEITIPITPRPEDTEPEDIPLKVVYEDEHILIVNKPAGMVVHPSLGNYTGTLVNALLHYTNSLSEVNEPGRPGIVHRIDKETSGLLVVAKDDWTHAQLAKQFAEHTIEREYHAVIWGVPKKREGEIVGNITRSKRDRKIFTVDDSEGKHAHTFYKVLEEFEFASLVSLKLKTGRTHQIRVHMAFINHPVFGDPTYGGRKIAYGMNLPKIKPRVNNLLEIMQRQALHAKTLGFYHPHFKRKIFVDSELPQDFSDLLDRLRQK